MVYLQNMPETFLKIKGWKCTRCGHEWVARKKLVKPIICPKCKNPYWDKPKKKD